MKKIKLLDRVQTVLHFYISHILATIQEYELKIEPALNTCCHKSMQFDIYVFRKRNSQTSLNFYIVGKHSIDG